MKLLGCKNSSSKIINKFSHSFKKPLVIAITSAMLCSISDWSYSAPASQSPVNSITGSTITASFIPASGSLVIGDNHYAYTRKGEPNGSEKSIHLQRHASITPTQTLQLKRLKSVSGPVKSESVYLMTSGSDKSIITVTRTKEVTPSSRHLPKSGFNAQNTSFNMNFTRVIHPSGSSVLKTNLSGGTLVTATNYSLSNESEMAELIKAFRVSNRDLVERINQLGTKIDDMVESKKTKALMGTGLIVTVITIVYVAISKCINYENFYNKYKEMQRVINRGEELENEKQQTMKENRNQNQPEEDLRTRLESDLTGKAKRSVRFLPDSPGTSKMLEDTDSLLSLTTQLERPEDQTCQLERPEDQTCSTNTPEDICDGGASSTQDIELSELRKTDE